MSDITKLFMGRIERVAGCSVVTEFRAAGILPFEAIQSYLEVPGRLVPIPRHPRSVVAAYLRVWTTIAAFLSLIAVGIHPFLVFVPLLMTLMAGYYWFFFGKLSPSEIRMRLAYAIWLEAPIDPALLAPDWPAPCLETLCTFVNDRAAGLATHNQSPASESWRIVAPESADPEFLVAALTRTRFARRGATPAEQKTLDTLHLAIWSKLEPLLLAGQCPRAYLEWRRHTEELERRSASMTPRSAAILAAILGVLAIASIPLVTYFEQPCVAIVNATTLDGLTVLLDGKPLATSIPHLRREKDSGVFMTRIPAGMHEFLAQDASGHEIDRQKFVLEPKKHRGLLYAPAPAINVCFYQERVTYSTTAARRYDDLVQLDRTKSLYLFSMYIDHWFEEAPEEIEMSGQHPTIEHFTVRLLPCDTKAPPLAR